MNEFKIRQRQKDDVVILDLQGFLDAHTAPHMEQSFQQLLTQKSYNILVNCKDLAYISSAGLGVFMAYLEEVRQHSGDIKFSNMPQKIYNIFDLLGFPLLYEIYQEEGEALSRFVDAQSRSKSNKKS